LGIPVFLIGLPVRASSVALPITKTRIPHLHGRDAVVLRSNAALHLPRAGHLKFRRPEPCASPVFVKRDDFL
jgi:hypothetical protein